MNDRRTLSRILVPVMLASVGLTGARGARAQGDRVTLPQDTIVRLRLEDHLNSLDSRVGDRFMASLSARDRSGFPEGTRFEGYVIEAEPRSPDRPGMIDVEIRRAFLPDGPRVELNARLTSLAEEDVRRLPDGRLVARPRTSRDPDWKWAGIGAGGGAVLAGVLGGQIVRGLLLGGLGGALFGILEGRRSRETYRNVDLPRGTEFGVRLEDRLVFDDQSGYRYPTRVLPGDDRAGPRPPLDDRDPRDPRRSPGPRPDDRIRPLPPDDRRPPERDDRVAQPRYPSRLTGLLVRVNGRTVRFDETRPHNLDGDLLVPLGAIADAADIRFEHRVGERAFTLSIAAGRVEGTAGDAKVTVPGRDDLQLDLAPVSLDGEIYVTPDFLDRALGFQVHWDPVEMRLDLDADANANR